MAIGNSKDLELRISAKNETGSAFTQAGENIKKFANAAEEATNSQKVSINEHTSAWGNLNNAIKYVKSSFSEFFSGVGSLVNGAISFIEKFGLSVYETVKSFIDVNSEFEKMKINMDVLTKGHGEEWFNKLNTWALDMPISINEVGKAFTTMNAYGLSPSLKLMRDMVDVSVLLPESGRAITGISRALGEIQAQGHLEGKNLRMLASWAVPGFEAIKNLESELAKKMGMSAEKMKYTMIDSTSAIKAILAVMEERFGGSAERLSHSWFGLTSKLTNYFKEFLREIGDAGVFDLFKKNLEGFIDFITTNFKSGEFQKLTKLIGKELTMVLEDTFGKMKFDKSGKEVEKFADFFVESFISIIKVVEFLYRSLLGIKLVLLIIKETWAIFAVVINGALYGIMYVLDRIIQGAIWVAKKIPGLSKEALASLDEQSTTSAELVKSAWENVAISAQIASNTGDAIVKTTEDIAKSAAKSETIVDDAREALVKYHEEAAKPVIIPTIEKPKPEYYGPSNVGPFGFDYSKSTEIFGPFEPSFLEKLSLAFDKWGLNTKKRLQDVKVSTYDISKSFTKMFEDIKNSIQEGLASAFEGIIKGNMNFMQSFNAIMKSIREAFIKNIASMLAEYVMIKGKEILVTALTEKEKTAVTVEGNAERVAANAAGEHASILITIANGLKWVAIQAYKAAAAMWAFFAALGPFGWLAGGVAAGAAIATIMAFGKKISSFETGTGLSGIKETGPALLHKGEIVLNKRDSDILRDTKNNGSNQQTQNVNLTFTISALDGADVEKIVKKKIIPAIRSNIRDFGIGRTMVKEAMR